MGYGQPRNEQASSFKTNTMETDRTEPIEAVFAEARRLLSSIPPPVSRDGGPRTNERSLSKDYFHFPSPFATVGNSQDNASTRATNFQTRAPNRSIPTGPRATQLVSQFPDVKSTTRKGDLMDIIHQPRNSSEPGELNSSMIHSGGAPHSTHEDTRNDPPASLNGGKQKKTQPSKLNEVQITHTPKKVQGLIEGMRNRPTRSGSNATPLEGTRRVWGSEGSKKSDSTMSQALRSMEDGRAPLLSPKLSAWDSSLSKTKIFDPWKMTPESIELFPERKDSSLSQEGGRAKRPPPNLGEFIPPLLQKLEKVKQVGSNTTVHFASILMNFFSSPQTSDRIATQPPTPLDRNVSEPSESDSISTSADSRMSTPALISPFPTWQGVSLHARDALTRIFVHENARHNFVIEQMKGNIDLENRLRVLAHDPEQQEQGSFDLPVTKPRGAKPTHEQVRSVLVERFRNQENQQESHLRRLQKRYRTLMRSWTRHCQDLDDTFAPDETVSTPFIEVPLTARTGRRTRGVLSDMVQSEFDLDEFIKKQAESDRVDAELLGRLNAAVIPDMIVTTKKRWSRFEYDDRNAYVWEPARFYGYDTAIKWSPEEMDAFREGRELYHKNFAAISTHPALTRRSVQDCVAYYYRRKCDSEMYGHNRGHRRKSHRASESVPPGGLGPLASDIRAGNDKDEDGRPEEEPEEDRESSASAYEQEGTRRPRARGRGRGRGRGGRGGGRGGARGAALLTSIRNSGKEPKNVASDANGDVEMADISDGDGPSTDPLSMSSRKRKKGMDEKEDGLTPGKPEKRKPISSYWTVADRDKLKGLIELHGDDFDSIASELSQKSGNQVRNLIRGRADLSQILDQALKQRAEESGPKT
jgi:hypothetical protein